MKSLENGYSWQIFSELAQHSFVVPLQSDVTLHAMFLFGGYDISHGIIAGLCAIMIVSLLNYALGYAISLAEKKLPESTQQVFAKGRRFFAGAGIAVVFFFWLPMGGVLPLVAGICRAPLLRMTAILLLGAVASFYRYF